MGRGKTATNKDRFQAAVDYLSEYAGVKGAVIVDSEGLAIAKSGQKDFDSDNYAAIGFQLVSTVNGALPKLIKPGIELISIKTSSDWLTIARSASLFLVVAAERSADDLLNIRITRSLDMVTAHVKEKYPYYLSQALPRTKEPAKEMEEINV